MNSGNEIYDKTCLKYSHKGCFINRIEIEANLMCGCFYCLTTFSPTEILDWIKEPLGGETAICPNCGIDSVLSSKYPITDVVFLKEMNNYWF
jgi:hypothetical protein